MLTMPEPNVVIVSPPLTHLWAMSSDSFRANGVVKHLHLRVGWLAENVCHSVAQRADAIRRRRRTRRLLTAYNMSRANKAYRPTAARPHMDMTTYLTKKHGNKNTNKKTWITDGVVAYHPSAPKVHTHTICI